LEPRFRPSEKIPIPTATAASAISTQPHQGTPLLELFAVVAVVVGVISLVVLEVTVSVDAEAVEVCVTVSVDVSLEVTV
jgi:hypothetical protein